MGVKSIEMEGCILEELRLGTARIPNNANIDVPPEVNAFMSEFVDTTHEHKKDCSLDILVTKNSWGYAVDKLVEKIRGVPHLFDLKYLFCLQKKIKDCKRGAYD